MSIQEEQERLLQKEWREEIIPGLGNRQWITVYLTRKRDDCEHLDLYSGLVPNERVDISMSSEDWDINADNCLPRFQWELDKQSMIRLPEYDRFGWPINRVEPLIFVRTFHGLRPKFIEISEEFRHFHNLFSGSNDTVFCKIDEIGDSIPVIRIHEHQVEIRRKELRQFLAVKNMSMALYFDRLCFSSFELADLGLSETFETVSGGTFIYRFTMFGHKWQATESYESWSRTWGKTLLRGISIEKVGESPFYDIFEQQYEDFKIGLDRNDEPITFTSDPDKLANFFGKNPDAPQFLTPVFFYRSVLDKYYTESSKYTVSDGHLYCRDLWYLPIDNNHPDFVIAFLGDLGDKLPFREQSHWKHHNAIAKGGLSETSWRRWFQQEGALPSDSAWRFRYMYMMFVSAWCKKYGWDLFKPLRVTDTHHFSKLRRPLTSETTEFHEIVLSLSILLQDSINIKELRKRIPDFESKDSDGKDKRNIPILGEYLESEGLRGAVQYVEYLRMLQMLRSNSGTVHRRNEKEYQKAAAFFSLDAKSTVQVADDIFTKLTEFLNSLREHFCPDETD